jgi:hypothetical protein
VRRLRRYSGVRWVVVGIWRNDYAIIALTADRATASIAIDTCRSVRAESAVISVTSS